MRRFMLAVPALSVFFLLASLLSVAVAQTDIKILEGAELTRVVPPGFYFKGLSAPTQMRNAAAARVGERYVVVGLVDTSGYSADVRERYQGFFITDSPITLNGSELPSGAYGFGYTNDGKLNILDLAGKDVLSLSTTKDNTLRRPRPLVMSKSPEGVRLYAGRDYAVIAFK
ncbi:MAG TPA: hypothetical protein VJ023_22325 [Pyrinomonadaceae bacterium]|nr:hypothetical protein [Pyrinomonadaceae bacterium]